ncbi:MAG: hypothetical protein GTO02_05105, partial [Candidatus Dadabacteria bacterium]|nr:hypothetical protein [Candidatus Dadabacteria bacterium]NIQ13789.1 hypothetical protein [Candidatus Dadabacteria bacterium]
MRLYRYLILKVTLIFFLSISLISGCSSGGSNGSSDESEDEVESMEFPQKYVAIGASLTAGVQSSGIVKGFQLNSFPY